MEDITIIGIEVKGIAPLLMHNPQAADPLNEYSIAQKTITAKGKKKSQQDMLELARLDYFSSLYYTPDIGVYLPDRVVKGAIRNGARKFRRGPDISAGLMVDEPYCKLIYDGPKTPETLFENPSFRDYRPVVVNRAAVMRMRPRFEKWGLAATLIVINEVLGAEVVKKALSQAGKYAGMGDFRPEFGRFEVVKFDVAGG